MNPRLDREDSPELLGLLNLLYDILEEHSMQVDFPFPMRKPGEGARRRVRCQWTESARVLK